MYVDSEHYWEEVKILLRNHFEYVPIWHICLAVLYKLLWQLGDTLQSAQKQWQQSSSWSILPMSTARYDNNILKWPNDNSKVVVNKRAEISAVEARSRPVDMSVTSGPPCGDQNIGNSSYTSIQQDLLGTTTFMAPLLSANWRKVGNGAIKVVVANRARRLYWILV